MDIGNAVLLYFIGYTALACLLLFITFKASRGRARQVLKFSLLIALPVAVIVFLFVTGIF
jgi:hypothetical protein